jgi:RNAse (barnase) inhibitor barstar
MHVSLARIRARNISDWKSFHAEFRRVFGFPEFYGHNMDAWIDCMTSLDEPQMA